MALGFGDDYGGSDGFCVERFGAAGEVADLEFVVMGSWKACAGIGDIHPKFLRPC